MLESALYKNYFLLLVFQENDTYTEFKSLKLEWGYGKWWCNTDWCVGCGMECRTLCDVE